MGRYRPRRPSLPPQAAILKALSTSPSPPRRKVSVLSPKVELLAANNLFSDTMGLTLGVDEIQELVTLQLAWDISRLDAEGFARIVNNLLAVAADWMLRLDQWRPSAPDGNGDEPAALSESMPFMNFLQV